MYLTCFLDSINSLIFYPIKICYSYFFKFFYACTNWLLINYSFEFMIFSLFVCRKLFILILLFAFPFFTLRYWNILWTFSELLFFSDSSWIALLLHSNFVSLFLVLRLLSVDLGISFPGSISIRSVASSLGFDSSTQWKSFSTESCDHQLCGWMKQPEKGGYFLQKFYLWQIEL